VLDNFEHVDEAGPLIGSAVGGADCPARDEPTPLRLYGEFEFRAAAQARRGDPLSRAARRGATFDEADAELLAAVCRRLDCLPLAIELVAARARDLSRDELSSLAGPLDLATGHRYIPARQQTLRATIGWSNDLLSTAKQALFRDCPSAGGAPPRPPSGLPPTREGSSLVAHSLLVPRHDSSGRRF
jgi:predicted ATPase